MIVTCKLCKTVTEQYIKLQKIDKTTWSKLADLEREEVNEDIEKMDTTRSKSLVCNHCRTVLMQKSKEELIVLLLDVAVPKIKP